MAATVAALAMEVAETETARAVVARVVRVAAATAAGMAATVAKMATGRGKCYLLLLTGTHVGRPCSAPSSRYCSRNQSHRRK